MQRIGWTAIVWTIFAGFGHSAQILVSFDEAGVEGKPLIVVEVGGQRYVSGEIIAVASSPKDGSPEGASIDALRALAEQRGWRVVGEVPALRLLRIQLRPGEAPTDVVNLMSSWPEVRSVETNGVGEGGALDMSSDPLVQEQWHLHNVGQTGGTVDADIDVPAAWRIERGSRDVVLAVLDSGIFFDNGEFDGRLVPGWDFVQEDPDPSAGHPHGHYVATIAAASAGDELGGVGVDPNCSVMPVRVLNNFNTGTVFDLVQGLMFCAENEVDVVCMSLINYPPARALQDALVEARAAGCTLFACAGNGGPGNADVSWPGVSPHTLSVGATNAQDGHPFFSGTGGSLDVVAPGALVVTSEPIGGLALFTGCSAATPIAAGIGCLLRAHDPTLTNDEIWRLVRRGAEDQVGPPALDLPGHDEFFGWGRVNAHRSLLALEFALPEFERGLERTE